MKTRSLVLILLVATALCLGGCKSTTSLSNTETVVGSGPVSTREFTVGEFTDIALESSPSLIVSIGEPVTVRVEAQENLLDLMTAEVEGDTLRLGVKPNTGYTSAEDVTFYVTTPVLEAIALGSSGNASVPDLSAADFSASVNSSGNLTLAGLTADSARLVTNSAGNIDVEALFADSLTAELSSRGNVTIASGEVDRQTVEVTSAGDYDSVGMSSREASVTLSSSGSADVSVSERLTGTLSSSGNLTYYGDPQVQVTTSSSGTVRQGG